MQIQKLINPKTHEKIEQGKPRAQSSSVILLGGEWYVPNRENKNR